jgi:hypothetical protein
MQGLCGITGDEGIARVHMLLNGILSYLSYMFGPNRPSYSDQAGMFQASGISHGRIMGFITYMDSVRIRNGRLGPLAE